MEVKFSKYHGLGNDFIIVDDYEEEFDYSHLARAICNRNTGIGADGLIAVLKDPLAMIYYNQDGSVGSMCGNGLRCFSKYVTDKKIVTEDKFNVYTYAGKYPVEMVKDLVKVEFPNISLDPKMIDIDTDLPEFLNKKVMDSICYAVFSGVSHLVVFVEDFKDIKESYAKALHEHPLFKSKINVNFVKIIERNLINILTYERGVGYTLACGTGSVASFKICRMLDLVDPLITVKYQVGDLILEEVDDRIFFTGPAIKIASGVFYLDNDEKRYNL